MASILDLAKNHDLKVIEDCAQAHGATIDGKPVGGFGDAAAWSFCQDKIMTTGGEGGMVTTNNPDLWSAMWSYKDHGKSYDAVYNRTHAPGFRWLHESFGTNWRMLEMQAAIGLLQLQRMPEWTNARTRNATAYASALSGFADLVRCPTPAENVTHAYYRQYAYVRPEALAPGWTRDRIIEEVNERGVPLYQGTCSEIYREKAFVDANLGPLQRLPVALELGETSLMMLTHPNLTAAEIEKTCSVLTDVLQKARR
jgi:dTDP-4-amino-4,6-dideoxygalactose transaminase